MHARCDGRGRPLGFVLTPGQTHDVKGFGPLFRMLGDRIEALLADKGYDADAIRAELAAAGVEAVIPTKGNRRVPSRTIARNTAGAISSSACLASSRTGAGLPPRYDKTKESYLGFVALASIKLWIPLSTMPSIFLVAISAQ